MSVMSKWPTSPARSGNSELGLSSNLEPHSVPASFNTHISASTVSACLKTGPFPYQHSPLTALTVWSSHHFQTHPYGYCYIVGFPVFQYITSPMISGFFRVKHVFCHQSIDILKTPRGFPLWDCHFIHTWGCSSKKSELYTHEWVGLISQLTELWIP